MRVIIRLSGVIGIGVLAACGKGNDAVPPPPPPPPPPPAHQVNINLQCPNDGGSINVHPWRVEVTKADGVKWNLAGNSKSIWITPKDPAHWPFDKDTIVVNSSDNPHTSINFKDSVEKGTYKYNIQGVCDNSGGADTVSLDPDMIIPTKISTR